MNPELQRNVWLNLTLWRLVGMPAVLGMVFLSAGSLSPGGWLEVVAPIARWFYVALVIVWGTWLAARAVVGEIRDRTWDGQRLSTLGPWTMLWGKLFGSTIYVWYGGVMCLAVILLDALSQRGAGGLLFDFAYYVSIGLFAHTVTLLASLLAVRRRSGHPRLEIFFYQFSGLVAAWLAWELWQVIRGGALAGDMVWLGYTFPAAQFFLWSLIAFVLWAIVGSWRLMRAELQMPGGPWLWLAFLGFMMVYAAGFADELLGVLGLVTTFAAGLATRAGFLGEPRLFFQLFLAFLMAGALTYAMAFFELKDWVRYRRLMGDFMRGRILSVFGRMQSWMFAFLALIGVGIALTFMGDGRMEFHLTPSQSLLPLFMEVPPQIGNKSISLIMDPTGLAFATIAFVARDLGLILFFNTGRHARRGEFAALVTLFVLYAVLPGIFRAAGILELLPVLSPFWPVIEQPDTNTMRIAFDWDRVLWPLAQAGIVWAAVVMRARASGKLVARAV